jgi:hypothetical protein
MLKKTDSSFNQEVKHGNVNNENKPAEIKKEKECCSGNSCTTPTKQASTPFIIPKSQETRKSLKTRIIIKYNVGFNNTIHLRGTGANLSWEKGIALKNIKADEWVWETDASFTSCEFKVLINDKQYEAGDNHHIVCGGTLQYSPRF